MKKFLVFLVAIVVVVCIGLTTYYFLRNDEAIDFKTKEIYCNVGDVITLDDLGYTVFKEHKDTTYNFNAGGEEVTQFINYNEDRGYYVANKGGEVNLLITTTNEKYAEFNITVHIGDGSVANPYYIDSQSDLQKIGDTYALNANYTLRTDITLSNDFRPIGYSYAVETYLGFSGVFNGNGHTISSLNLTGTEYANAGLFTTLNAGSVVTDLNIKDVEISGAYQTAGALAGTVNGIVSRVQAVNVNIANTMNNSKTGALIGSLSGENSTLTISSVQDAVLTIGTASTAENPTISSITGIAGGLVGEIDKAKVQATFADTEISLYNASGDIGGFAGKLIIGTNSGSIQESYSVSTSTYANFGSFIGTIEKDGSFVLENANQLRHLVGNYVLASSGNVVNSYDDTLFTRGFYNEADGIYFIVQFNNLAEMANNTEYVFYAIDQNTKTYWDNSAWNIIIGSLPRLRMTNANLSSISSEYFLKDLEEETIGTPDNDGETNAELFMQFIEDCLDADGAIVNKKYVLGGDVDLTGVSWTPIELKNSIIDGNGYKITGLNLTNHTSGDLGLFSVIDNSTIRDLVIENVVLNTTGATNVGALAGRVISTTAESASFIENVQVVYSTANLGSSTYFGGLVARLDNNSTMINVGVSNLNLPSSNSTSYVGGLIGIINDGTLAQANITSSTIYGTLRVGGAVAENYGTIDNLTGNVVVKYAQDNNDAYVAGISALNNGTISNSNMTLEMTIEQTNRTLQVGGVSAINNGTILNVRMLGTGIALNDVNIAQMYVGGIVATNNSTINNAYNLMATVGSYYEGKDFYVGGIAANNSTVNSSISQAIAGSDIYGNYVSGVVVNMANASATVSQVLVANFNPEGNLISENYITGDKFVAGICYNFTYGTITDIQAVSQLYGQTNNTRTSLLVLEFPNTATLRNATIDSTLNGYGTFYRETWKDKTSEGTSDNYNIYAGTAASGRMESVVINTDRAGYYGKSYISAEFRGGQFNTSYNQTGNYNNVKTVNSSEFNQSSTFRGTHTLTARVWGLFIPYNQHYERELTFDFANNVWTNRVGIILNFLTNV